MDDKVYRWRLGLLLTAGFEESDAGRMAGDRDVDVYRALELLKQGCPPATAVRIVT